MAASIDKQTTLSEAKSKQPVQAIKKQIVEEDDAFEDFPAQDHEDTNDPERIDHAWADSYEDDDEAADFYAILQKEKDDLKKGVEPMRQ